MNIALIIPILLPIIAGILIQPLKLHDRKKRENYVSAVVIVNFLIVVSLAIIIKDESLTILHLNRVVDITFKIDGMSRLFTCLASLLWVTATFYSFEYMKHEGMDERFYTFFVVTIGALIGIGYAANLPTLYLFYEMMTLVTFPLVMHSQTEQSIAAGKKYLAYSFIGANVALAGFFFLNYYCDTIAFVPGGSLDVS